MTVDLHPTLLRKAAALIAGEEAAVRGRRVTAPMPTYTLHWLRRPHCAEARPVKTGRPLQKREKLLRLLAPETETAWVCRHERPSA